MKKRLIAIVYDNECDAETAEMTEAVLADMGYDVVTYHLDEEKTIESVYAGWSSVPHLIITLNHAGFSYRSSGDNAVYATLDVNTIHYINRDVEGEERLLSGLITITEMFITDSEERKKRIESSYRRIHDVRVSAHFSAEIGEIVDKLDWRQEL